jgi:hypothetical protein
MRLCLTLSFLLFITAGCSVVTAPVALLSLPVKYAYLGLKEGVGLLVSSNESEEESPKEEP